MTKYQNLEAWKVSMQLVKEIYFVTQKYLKTEQYGLVSQIRRAVISVPSNIAEGLGRQHKNDKIHFLHISRGSAHEVQTLLHISKMAGAISEQDSREIFILIDKTLRIINGFINYMKESSPK
ncbi:MAG: four helix bundle protein [Chitinophagales bacterium]